MKRKLVVTRGSAALSWVRSLSKTPGEGQEMGVRELGHKGLLACAMAFGVALVASRGDANAQFPQPIPTRITLVRFGGSPAVGRQYKLVSKVPRGGPLFQLPSSSPATTGGSLTVTIGSGTLSCTLAPGLFNGTAGWKELGNPAGSKGYKYLNKNAPTADPCKLTIVKEKVIRVLAAGTGTIAAPVDYPPGNPDISTVLTLGGEEYCGYAAKPHDSERADRYIRAKGQSAPGSCPAGPTTTSTTTTPSTTTTTITLACNCCSGGLDFLSFETGIGSGSCGVLRNFRCLNDAAAACVDDSDCDFGPCYLTPPLCSGNFSVSCSDDSDCAGTCDEVVSGSLPLDLGCGAAYTGGGLNSVPLPITVPDQNKFYVRVTGCDGGTGEMTLGPTTPAEVGTRYCTQGRQCSNNGSPCVVDRDCGAGTCQDLCLFGAPVPIPNAYTPSTSYCMVNVVAEDASGTAQCAGGAIDLTLPRRSIFYLTGDMFKSSTPPDIPGVQPCPLCDYLCQGGSKDKFPCGDDSECPGGTCGAQPECLGGIEEGSPCTPATSDDTVLGDGYPVSHDCQPDPLQDITAHIGGLPIGFGAATTGAEEWNAVDRPNGVRVFCGYCRDVTGEGSLCFEGDPGLGWCCFGVCHPGGGRCLDDSECPGGSCAFVLPWYCPGGPCLDNSECPEGTICSGVGETGCPPSDDAAVLCTSDADCDDGDEYESCVQRDPGAFSEAASTRISVTGSTDGGCLADGQPHPADLVSLFCIPPTFDPIEDPRSDLPGPGAAVMQGEVRLQ